MADDVQGSTIRLKPLLLFSKNWQTV